MPIRWPETPREALDPVDFRYPRRSTRAWAGCLQVFVAFMAIFVYIQLTLVSGLIGEPGPCVPSPYDAWVSAVRSAWLPFLLFDVGALVVLLSLLIASKRCPGVAYWGVYVLSFALGVVALLYLGALSTEALTRSCWTLSNESGALQFYVFEFLALAAVSTIFVAFLGLPVEYDGERVRGLLL